MTPQVTAVIFPETIQILPHMAQALEGRAYSLIPLLRICRQHEASDPRDNIYALFGACDKESTPFTTYPEGLIPDYNIDVQTLFIRTTRVLLQSSRKAWPSIVH
jgi:hypothetical protein